MCSVLLFCVSCCVGVVFECGVLSCVVLCVVMCWGCCLLWRGCFVLLGVGVDCVHGIGFGYYSVGCRVACLILLCVSCCVVRFDVAVC